MKYNRYTLFLLLAYNAQSFAMESPKNSSCQKDQSVNFDTNINQMNTDKLIKLRKDNYMIYSAPGDRLEKQTLKRKTMYTINGPAMLTINGLKEKIECYMNNKELDQKHLEKKSKIKWTPWHSKKLKTNAKNVLKITTISKFTDDIDISNYFYTLKTHQNLISLATQIEVEITTKIIQLIITLSKFDAVEITSNGSIDFYSDDANVSAYGGWITINNDYHECSGNFLTMLTNHTLGKPINKTSPIVRLETTKGKLITLYPVPKKEK